MLVTTFKLKKRRTQQFIHIFILALWLIFGIKFIKYKYGFSPFQINSFYLISVSLPLLIAPIISKHKFGWICSFTFVLFHFVWTSLKVVFSFLADINRDYTPKSSFLTKDIIISIILISVSFLITIVVWIVKPRNEC